MESLDKVFDVIVVGAGTGGATAARFAAQNGLDVCLLDRKPRNEIGSKICGDAVGKEIFTLLNIKPPRGEELSCPIIGAKLYPPNREKCIEMKDPKQTGYIIDRIKFGQRLLKEALEAGVNTFLDNTMALDLVYTNKIVSGVKIKLENGEKVDLKSKIVIDASGLYSPLRKKIESDIIEKEISDTDAILCYREIVTFPKQDQEVQDPQYISIILDQEKAPGGYIWYFPKDDHSLNIGLGVYMNYGGKVKDLYKKHVYNEFINASEVKILSSGGGVAPVRRPLWSCVDNGIMFVGDAAFQVNPLHGGGIDPSMRGGYYAALTAASAIESGDYSMEKLWDYNCKVMINFGAEFAALDLLRRVLQSLSNSDLNFGLQKDLLTASEILQIAETGDLTLSLWDMAFKAFKGIMRPDLLLDLNYLRLRMNEIAKIYKHFPKTSKTFPQWKERVREQYKKIEKMIIDLKSNRK
ncbi:MAG: Digeranylgeranylglycerophospholipid reductase [Promethearchaeota archaeon]|nr:MAG: Digeranylgeranylglycerophospholipid reductase [Candidatus Lokiarchaeota archaeon]